MWTQRLWPCEVYFALESVAHSTTTTTSTIRSYLSRRASGYVCTYVQVRSDTVAVTCTRTEREKIVFFGPFDGALPVRWQLKSWYISLRDLHVRHICITKTYTCVFVYRSNFCVISVVALFAAAAFVAVQCVCVCVCITHLFLVEWKDRVLLLKNDEIVENKIRYNYNVRRFLLCNHCVRLATLYVRTSYVLKERF